jgi:hypothetical protein
LNICRKLQSKVQETSLHILKHFCQVFYQQTGSVMVAAEAVKVMLCAKTGFPLADFYLVQK